MTGLREHLSGPEPRAALGGDLGEPALTVHNVLLRALSDGAAELTVSPRGLEWSGGQFMSPSVQWLETFERVLRRDAVIRAHLALDRTEGDARVYRFT